MPELAAMYTVGFVTELVVMVLFVLSHFRRLRRGPSAILRSNLTKVGVYWSEHTEKIVAGSTLDELHDRRSSLKTIVFTGTLLAFLSWLGALFFTILMLSHRHLARSRLERELFDSRLARDPNLTAHDVRELVAALTSTPPSPGPDARPPEFAE